LRIVVSGSQTIFGVKSGVECVSHIVIEEDLLHSADRVARRLEVSRFALIGDALRGHPKVT